MLAEIFRLRLEATARAAKERSFYMRMRPTHGAAAVFAATLAATVGSSGPAKAFFFLRSSSSRSPRSSPNPAGARATIVAGGAATGEGTRPPSPSRPPGRARSATRRNRAPPRRTRAESRRRNPRPAPRRPRAPAAFVRSRLRARAAAASAPRCAEKAPRLEAVRRPPRSRPSSTGPNANAAAQAPSSARAGSTLGDTYDEKLGAVFKARIDELIKQSN